MVSERITRSPRRKKMKTKMKPLAFELRNISTQIGSSSLVGIVQDGFPLPYGNYFTMGGYSILNMWLENLEHLREEGGVLSNIPTLKAYCSKLGSTAIIVDERIPKNYLNETLCFTGASFPKAGLAYREAYRLVTPDWETDPKTCFCDEKYNRKSVAWYMVNTMKGVKEGTCRICARTFLHHFDPVPAGLITIPYVMKMKIPEVRLMDSIDTEKEITSLVKDGGEGLPGLLRRFAEKKVNPNFFGKITIPPENLN